MSDIDSLVRPGTKLAMDNDTYDQYGGRMKSFNEWLENRDSEFNKNEGWWPWSRKDAPSGSGETLSEPGASGHAEPSWWTDPKNKLKGEPGQFAKCPHCGYGDQVWVGMQSGTNECWRCRKRYWLDDDQEREAKRQAAWSSARRRGADRYEFDGESYHTDPKGAARAKERAKNAIRGDLSNI